MQQDPFAPKYGNVPNQPQPMQTYGGLPVQPPKKGMNWLLFPFIIAIVLLLGAIGFGFWAFAGMQDYKNNVQPKIDKAVAIAEQKTSTAKDAEFVEKEKSPLREYKTSQAAGSIVVLYPKTWSAYVSEKGDGSNVVDGFFHPSYVPDTDSGTGFALRLRVLSTEYAEHLKQFESSSKAGKVKISPYKAPKMPDGTVGTRIDGAISNEHQGSMVIFPLRDKTIEISTESTQFTGDFDKIVLANLTYSP